MHKPPVRAASVAALLVAAVGAQTVHVVDDAPGPGVDFTSLPAAVAAAAPGDVLHVMPGNYEPFSAPSKALTIRGSGAASTVIDGAPAPGFVQDYVAIQAPPVGAVFRMSGIAVRRDLVNGGSPSGPPQFGRRIAVYGTGAAAGGSVVLTDVVSEPVVYGGNAGGVGLYVFGAAVHASRGVFKGGGGSPDPAGADPRGAHGVETAADARLALDGCLLVGGDGVGPVGGVATLVVGASGLLIGGGEAFLHRTSSFGGTATAPAGTFAFCSGGAGVYVPGPGNLRIAGEAGTTIKGGTGLSVFGSVTGARGVLTGTGSVVAIHTGATVQAGGTPPIGAPTGGAGLVTFSVPPLPVTSSTGAALPDGAWDAAQPTTVSLDVASLPGGLFVLFAALAPGYQSPFGAALTGPALVASFDGVLVVGQLDAAGHFGFSLVAATDAPALLDVPLHLQGFAYDAGLGVWRASNAEIRTLRL
jgi:hypothetical protein